MWNFDKYNKVALIDDSGEKITYEHLNVKCRKSVELIGARSLVLLVCTNTIECVQFYLGCITKKIVVMLVDAKMESGNIISLVKEYSPSYIYVPSEFNMLDMGLRNVLVINNDYIELRADKSYVLYQRNEDDGILMNDELAVLLSTSGSTGSKKFVRISYGNLISNANSIVEYLEMDETEIPILHLPISYSYGISVLNTTLLVGGTVVLTEKSVIDKKFWRIVIENSVTTFIGVPFHYEILKRMHINKEYFPSLRVMTQAGGKLSEKMQMLFGDYAQEYGIKFFVMYGQTEATARMTYLPSEKVREKIGSVGKSIPNGEIYIVNEDGNVINQPYEKGEIVYKGENVSLGYAIDVGDLCKGDDFNGELNTGDIGYKDEEGLLYITGRKNRICKYYGNRVQLDDVENRLNKIFGYVFAINMIDNKLYVMCDEEIKFDLITNQIVKYTNILEKHIFYIKGKIPRKKNGKISYDFIKNI